MEVKVEFYRLGKRRAFARARANTNSRGLLASRRHGAPHFAVRLVVLVVVLVVWHFQPRGIALDGPRYRDDETAGSRVFALQVSGFYLLAGSRHTHTHYRTTHTDTRAHARY